MNSNLNDRWIGKGISFPKIFNKVSGSSNISEGNDRINQSINMILSTPLGTRFFLPSFGSELFKAVFEPNDYILKDMIEMYVKDALRIWEPRITVLKVDARVDSGSDTVPINIYYRLTNSNITNNYVYPFVRGVMNLE